ncbi:TetR/AcrR family transcriptional regulator [Tropicimonas sp. TH_r6]|uniref:TetR/AcrR family transcriptional regulator n=1 Tax=Tropicimonas sp. TH_r6 TaxID=3082085 RepID=UPI0029538D4A|nr:TetR/AcrR family transcriptional regulator [Tropicimonas sp. TH_r6]MDV7143876.1 TetR/AcrR family transcriptional regulator [Tropicimonas sp. TH_r6]
MKDREATILDAARRLFLRYGVKRTSMNDISQEAGISRQTLYNAYSNKDAVLCALIRDHAEQAHVEILAGLETTTELGAQLDLVFDRVVVSAYDLLMEAPNSADLVEGFNSISQAEIDAAYAQVRTLLAQLLAPHKAAIGENGLGVQQLADFVQRMAKAAKTTASNRAHLLDLLQTLKIATLKLAGV